MALPKFYTFIKVLDKDQKSSLGKYLLTYIGDKSDVYKVYAESIKFLKSKEEEELDIEEISSLILPGVKFKVFLNYLSQLYDIALEWAAVQDLLTSEPEKDLKSQKWLNRHGLYKLADQIKDKNLKKLKSQAELNVESSKLISEIYFDHAFSANPQKYSLHEEEYIDMIHSFDEYVSGQFFIMFSELQNLEELTKSRHYELSHYLQMRTNSFKQSDLLYLLKMTHKMVETYDLDALLYVKNSLFSNKLTLGSRMHAIITTYAIKRALNYWTKGIHKDSTLINDLTNYGLKTGIYSQNGKIPAASFHNLVVNLNISMSLDKLEEFVSEWMPFVSCLDRDATQQLVLAQCYFYSRKFDLVPHNLNVGKFDFNQKNILQGLLLSTAFMNRNTNPDEWQRLYKASHSFIKNNETKMSSHLFKSYENLLRFLRDFSSNNFSSLDDYNPLLYRSFCQYVLEKE